MDYEWLTWKNLPAFSRCSIRDVAPLTLCSYFANALGFDTLLIQLNNTWSFSRLIAILFCRIEETGNLYFFRNLHLLSFPMIYNLPCFRLKWRAYEFFPRGHPRRSGVTLRLTRDHKLKCAVDHTFTCWINTANWNTTKGVLMSASKFYFLGL